MATKTMNLRMDEEEMIGLKKTAEILHTTVTDIVKTAIREYLDGVRKDPYYMLTANIPEADPDESEEVLEAVGQLGEDDLQIVRTRKIKL